MDESNSLIDQRKAKLASLRAKGIDPFRNKFVPTESCAEARHNYAEGREVALAGRITAHRDMGKSMFIDIKDQSGRIQVYAQKNTLGDEQFEIFKHLDLGDFLGGRGTMFTTKTGEISVKLTSFVILAKALRPPPAKWHGLEDTEIRYRQRYLDLIANDEVKDVFLKRAAIVREMRNFMHSRGYVEVETPMMQAIPGGAAAQPFVTYHNALGCNFHLRIALELYHKRLLVGGIDRVFEIGRIFRNEGLSRRHNPEFTMMEAYQAFGDYETMMETVQSMVCHVAEKVLGTLALRHERRAEVRSAINEALMHLLDASEIALGETADVDRAANYVEPFFSRLKESRDKLNSELPLAIASSALGTLKGAIAFLETERQKDQHRKPWGDEVVSKVFGRLDLARHKLEPLTSEKIIDLMPAWKRIRYKDVVREKSGADWFDISPAERRQRAHDLGAEIGKEYEDFEVTGAVFEKLIEPTLIQPTFVTHLPKELVPLAKLSPDDPTTVEVFELCINGQEIAPGYTEQNNPIEQRERLEHQAGGEQQKLDEDLLVALEHGMPPRRRHRHRHRPPLHDAPRPGKYPRRDSLPAAKAEVNARGAHAPRVSRPAPSRAGVTRERIPRIELVHTPECSARARNTAREARALPKPSRTIPIEPRERLEHQAGGEQQKPDFLVALEHGMPPRRRHRHRHRHRPPLHDAPRPGKHPRRDSLPAVETEVIGVVALQAAQLYASPVMTVTIPSERLGNVPLSERDAVVDIAIGLYKREEISLGRAAEVAGLSSVEFLTELGCRRIPINYGVDDLKADVAALNEKF
jgi:lysyl-tRNA synthetase class 2